MGIAAIVAAELVSRVLTANHGAAGQTEVASTALAGAGLTGEEAQGGETPLASVAPDGR